MTTVGAFPDDDGTLLENGAVLYVLEQGAVAFLVLLLNFGHALKQEGDFVKALLRASLAKVA